MKQFIRYNILFATAVFFCVPGFGQAVNPTQNKPTAPGSLPPVGSYPLLADYSNSTYRNYVRTFTPQKPMSNEADITLPKVNSNIATMPVQTAYVDGLGRPLQEVVRHGAFNGNDLVKAHVYDNRGREAIQYQPFNGNMVANDRGELSPLPATSVTALYNNLYPGEYPYSQQLFDNSPLNRVTKAMAPGASWIGLGRGTINLYRANTATENVRIWTIGFTSGSLPVSAMSYPDGELGVVETYDEDGNLNVEYKDKSGRVVLLKKGQQSGIIAQTYYVYDDLGRLRFVIPPLAVQQMSGWNLSGLERLCYRYEYDQRGRPVMKIVADKDEEYMVYDKKDRLVLTQDGNLRNTNNRWAFTIYDVLGRPLVTGIWTKNISREQLAIDLAGSGGFSANDLRTYLLNDQFNQYPTFIDDAEILTNHYYDDYSSTGAFAFDNSLNSKLTGTAPYAETPITTTSKHTRGLVTGTKVKVMDPGSSVQWLSSVNYYDDKGRVVQRQGNNIKGGTDIATNQYEFDGTLISSVSKYNNPDAVSPDGAYPNLHKQIEVVQRFTKNYGRGSVYRLEQNVNGTGWKGIYTTEIDELGRLKGKTQGGAIGANFTYNIRGWLTGINPGYIDGTSTPTGPFFGEQLFYDRGFASKLYNGNIAGIVWKGHGTNAQKRFYGYSYDVLNRLNHAEFGQWKPSVSDYTKDVIDYSATDISYDVNGNLLTMNQMGPGYINNDPATPGIVNMDHLVYSYFPNSNRVKSVLDDNAGQITTAPDFKDGNVDLGVDDYGYDNNGNLTVDRNKGIFTDINYSHLNKPTWFKVNGKGEISYIYDATGNRLRKTMLNEATQATETWDYMGPMVFKDDKLQLLLHEEGRCRPIATTTDGLARFEYDYFIKDHLGNVRTVVNEQPTGLGGLLDPREYRASMEVALANTENLIWDNIDPVRDDKPGGAPGDGKAAHLVGTDPTRRIGTALLLKVMPGDHFKVGFQSYWSGEADNSGDVGSDVVAGSLLTALTGGSTYSGVPVSEIPENIRTIESSIHNPGFSGAWQTLHDNSFNQTLPDAGLSYMVLDENFRVIQAQSGVLQVGATQGQWNNVGLSSPLEIGQPGYLVVFLSSRSHGSIYADNVQVMFYKGSVLEEDHYYPFGLTLSQTTPNPLEQNKYKLTTKELQSDFDLNVYDFGARMQDMQIGRWNGVDAKAEKFSYESPYVYAGNNPVKYLDPDGRTKTVYNVIYNSSNGKIAVKVSSSPGLMSVKQLDIYDNRSFDWYDYAVVNIVNVDKNGKILGSGTGTYRGLKRTNTVLNSEWMAKQKVGDGAVKEKGFNDDGWILTTKNRLVPGNQNEFNIQGRGREIETDGIMSAFSAAWEAGGISGAEWLPGGLERDANFWEALDFLREGNEMFWDLGSNEENMLGQLGLIGGPDMKMNAPKPKRHPKVTYEKDGYSVEKNEGVDTFESNEILERLSDSVFRSWSK